MRLGYTTRSQRANSASDIKDHAFFSTHPLSSSEEMRYQSEGGARMRWGGGSLNSEPSSVAGSLVRRLSITAGQY